MSPNDCEHTKIETLYQYDKQKNRTLFWACPECHMLFQPKGLADADLVAENDALKKRIDGLLETLDEKVQDEAQTREWGNKWHDKYFALLKGD